jgi:hypothetical protein
MTAGTPYDSFVPLMTAGTPYDSFLYGVADMSADISATHWPDRHISVILTLVLTHQHPTLPAKSPSKLSDNTFWQD